MAKNGKEWQRMASCLSEAEGSVRRLANNGKEWQRMSSCLSEAEGSADVRQRMAKSGNECPAA